MAGKPVAASPRCGVLVAMLVAAPDFWVPCCLFVWAGLLGVPVGGGPPASRPRCELRSARRLEARPGPAGSAAASNRAGLGACVLALALPPPTGTAAWPRGLFRFIPGLSRPHY